ncbi:hypothetical protein BZA77DRAFT_293187 [Pyronema omphalodes]|nr:hypothetical protein BZA77DRAFT_293187 [Pyronema omphalodes]
MVKVKVVIRDIGRKGHRVSNIFGKFHDYGGVGKGSTGSTSPRLREPMESTRYIPFAFILHQVPSPSISVSGSDIKSSFTFLVIVSVPDDNPFVLELPDPRGLPQRVGPTRELLTNSSVAKEMNSVPSPFSFSSFASAFAFAGIAGIAGWADACGQVG